MVRHHLRGLVRRAQRWYLTACLSRGIRTGGALALVLLALPDLENTGEAGSLLDRTADWIAAVHPGAVVATAMPGQIAVLLPGASLARAQQFCEQLRHPTYGQGAVAEYLGACVQGVAGWDPGLSVADLWRRAESALHSARSGQAPAVLYHDSLPRLIGTGPGPSWEDWEI